MNGIGRIVADVDLMGSPEQKFPHTRIQGQDSQAVAKAPLSGIYTKTLSAEDS